MKTIGLLGGMSWESSIVYEQILNQQVRARLGGVHSASLLIRSYDFAVIEHLQAIGDESRKRYLEIISQLADRGAQGIIAGCTEIELLVHGDDAGLPYFPTTRLHAEVVAELALTDG